MPVRISFATNKGGCGKTASTAFVASTLAEAGYKVLAIDLDSQGNLTRILSQNSIYQYSGRTIMEAIQNGNAKPCTTKVRPGLDLIPAEDRFATFSRYIQNNKIANPYGIIKRLIAPIESNYDFVFIDVGPSLGDAMINAIVYADHIIIPIDAGEFAMDAMVRFTEFVNKTRAEGHTNAVISGILITMRDGRQTKYEEDIAAGLRSAYGELVFNTEIRRRVRIKEMVAIGINTIDNAMEDYISLTEEIVQRTIKRKENKL